MLRSRTNPNWHMQARDLYPLLGLKTGHHLPDAGLPAQDIDGTFVYVLSKSALTKHKQQRVIAICDCGQHVPFGKIGQHLKGKAHR